MAVQLATLVQRLIGEIPAVNNRPAADQYETAVTGAVADFSARAGLERVATLSVVAGTAEYQLPADFLRLIRIERHLTTGDVLVQPGGLLIPLAGSLTDERVTVQGNTLTITPTPAYSMDRRYWYRAAYALNEAGQTYPEMTDQVAEIVLVKARALCLSLLGIDAAREAWRYTFADVQVDKGNLHAAYLKLVESQEADYERRVKAYTGGSTATVASLSSTELDALMGGF